MVLFEDKDEDGIITTESMSTDPADIEVLQRNFYYAFGLPMQGPWNHAPADPDMPYLYNGKELEGELGLGWMDYGARRYDAAIGRWGGVDPLAHLYYGWSSYNYVLGNPISFVDPDGRSVEGDFVNSKGEKIGDDGKSDGKMYVINTSIKSFKGVGGNVTGAGLSRKDAKASENFVKANSGNSAAFDANPDIYSNFTEYVGDAGVRQEMVDIVSADNGKGGTSPANNREYNGGIMPDGSVAAGTPGAVSRPTSSVTETGAYPIGTEIPFHSHPSGTETRGGGEVDPFGGTTTMGVTEVVGYRQSPSPGDVSRAGTGIRYVFGRGDGTVYMYNNSGIRATLPIENFVNFK